MNGYALQFLLVTVVTAEHRWSWFRDFLFWQTGQVPIDFANKPGIMTATWLQHGVAFCAKVGCIGAWKFVARLFKPGTNSGKFLGTLPIFHLFLDVEKSNQKMAGSITNSFGKTGGWQLATRFGTSSFRSLSRTVDGKSRSEIEGFRYFPIRKKIQVMPWNHNLYIVYTCILIACGCETWEYPIFFWV